MQFEILLDRIDQLLLGGNISADLKQGICHALNSMWIHAVLCNDLKTFHERLILICEPRWNRNNFENSINNIFENSIISTFVHPINPFCGGPLNTAINKVKQKVKETERGHKVDLSNEEKLLLSILSFIEAIVLYQNPKLTSLSSQLPVVNTKKASCYVMPDNLTVMDESTGRIMPLKIVFHRPIILFKTDFSWIKSILEDLLQKYGKKMPFAMSISSKTHTIGVAYSYFLNNSLNNNNDLFFQDNLSFGQFDINAKRPYKTIFESLSGDPIYPSFNYIAVDICVYISPKSAIDIKSQIERNLIEFYRKHFQYCKQIILKNPAYKNALFNMAASFGHEDIVSFFLTNFGVDINGFYLREFPLFSASAHGHTNIVKLLLKEGAKVDQKSIYSGVTSLVAATVGGFADIVRLLLNYGANFNAVDAKGHTLCNIALHEGHAEIFRMLNPLQPYNVEYLCPTENCGVKYRNNTWQRCHKCGIHILPVPKFLSKSTYPKYDMHAHKNSAARVIQRNMRPTARPPAIVRPLQGR